MYRLRPDGDSGGPAQGPARSRPGGSGMAWIRTITVSYDYLYIRRRRTARAYDIALGIANRNDWAGWVAPTLLYSTIYYLLLHYYTTTEFEKSQTWYVESNNFRGAIRLTRLYRHFLGRRPPGDQIPSRHYGMMHARIAHSGPPGDYPSGPAVTDNRRLLPRRAAFSRF